MSHTELTDVGVPLMGRTGRTGRRGRVIDELMYRRRPAKGSVKEGT
jgi:hypothetical protein